MDFKLKYLKYKDKYLSLKNKLDGGYLLTKDNSLTTKCDDSKKNSIFLPQICGEDKPCLSADKKCYDIKPSSKIPDEADKDFFSELIENIFSEIYDEKNDKLEENLPIIIKLESFYNLEEDSPFLNPELIVNKELLNLGGFGNIFYISDFSLNKIDYVIKLFSKSLTDKIMKDNKSFEEICNIQMFLAEKSIFINKIYDFGSYTLMKNNKELDLNFKFKIKEEFMASADSNEVILVNKIDDDSSDEEVDLYYSILEKCNGNDLLELVKTQSLPEKRATTLFENNIEFFKKIMIQILRGLKTIHEYGYIHADIKLDNICFLNPVLEENGDLINNPEIKIIDFDFVTEIETEIYFPRGSKYYVSPKVMKSSKSSPKVLNQSEDIFAIGVSMFILLFGYYPIKYVVNNNKYEIKYNKFYGTDIGRLKNKYPDLYKIIVAILDDYDESSIETVDQIIDSKFFEINLNYKEGNPFSDLFSDSDSES